MKIATVIGARPQFIKSSVVSQQIAKYDELDEVLIHTGQHYDVNMSDVFFREMRMPLPAYELGIAGGLHGQMTGRQLEAIEQVLVGERPDMVLVYGDTNSTIAGALAGAKLNIPVAHVESGLRSFNKHMPEEINRIATDHVSDLLLAPSETAVSNLQREGLAVRTRLVGDVMYDVALAYATEAENKSKILEQLEVTQGGFRLATVHRAENTDNLDRLRAIFSALRELARSAPLVLPLHPRTRKILEESGDFNELTAALDIIKPVGIFDIIRLLQGAQLVLTDSGGLQKEAYFHGTPVVVLREETEWTELLDFGWARLPLTLSSKDILNAARIMEHNGNRKEAYPYGRGDAGPKIVENLLKWT